MNQIIPLLAALLAGSILNLSLKKEAVITAQAGSVHSVALIVFWVAAIGLSVAVYMSGKPVALPKTEQLLTLCLTGAARVGFLYLVLFSFKHSPSIAAATIFLLAGQLICSFLVEKQPVFSLEGLGACLIIVGAVLVLHR